MGPEPDLADTEVYPQYYAYKLIALLYRERFEAELQLPTRNIMGRDDADSIYNAYLSPTSNVPIGDDVGHN